MMSRQTMPRALGLLLFWAFAGLSACESDSKNSLSVTGLSGDEVKLNGTWQIDCVKVDADTSTTYIWKESGDRYRYREIWYDTPDCSGSETFEFEAKGDEAIGEATSATWSDTGAPDGVPNTVTAYLETATDTDATATFFGADAVDYANSVEAYGYSDWEDGVSKDVLGLLFDGSTWDQTAEDLIFIDDTGSDDTWYSGDASTAGADGYPKQLWPHNPGMRQ